MTQSGIQKHFAGRVLLSLENVLGVTEGAALWARARREGVAVCTPATTRNTVNTL